MKLSDWLRTWLEKYVRHTVKLQTYNRYADACRLHIVPMLGEYELEDLSASVLQDFVLQEIEHGNHTCGAPLAGNTLLGIVSVLKRALKDALALGCVEKIYISAMRLPQQEEKQVSAFTRAEQEVIEQFCLSYSNKNYFGVVICLYTGIRLGELLALTWQDVDFTNGWITIEKTAYTTRADGVYTTLIDKPKTKSSVRTIPIPSPLLKILKRFKKISSSLYVLSTRTGGIIDARSYQRTFESILRKCDIPHKNFHALRHTFATRALECGMDVKTLSELLGHKNASVTLNRYAHSFMLHKVAMVNKMGKILCV